MVDVVYEIQEGARSKVADLQIFGNTRTKENVIRRESIVRPGDVFRAPPSCGPSGTSSRSGSSRT